MNLEPIKTPIDWHTEYPPIGSPRKRKMHVSSCGRVKIIPQYSNGRSEVVWKIEIDGIDLNHTWTGLAKQKRFTHAHLLRTRGQALESGTVVWIYFVSGPKVPREPVGVRFMWPDDLDEMARETAGIKPTVKVHRRIVSPRQDRLD